ncbi:DUF4365 domain-containing protein [Streptomyces griseoincarnatus]|nr:DUF4365 domain-containing protein [Actinospica acidiphila]
MAKVRPTRRIERAGVNALRALLEEHDHIVQEIDGGNDHGEDLYVMLTRNGRRTGHVFAVQVKSGKKYKRSKGYAIPIEDHGEDWRESRIPVIGVVYDREQSSLYWVNLSKKLRGSDISPKWIQVPQVAVLSDETIRGFAAEVESYIDHEGMRIRGATREEVFSGAARAREGLDPETTPNPLYEGLADLALKHEKKLSQAGRIARRYLPLLLLCLIMAIEWPYQVRFAEKYGSGVNPFIWAINLYFFMLYMALTILFEFRAGRLPANTGRFFALITGNFLWLPVIDSGGTEDWWGPMWVFIGGTVPNVGYTILLTHYVASAVERRKKMRQGGTGT